MKTVKDFLEYKAMVTSGTSVKVDTWLEEVVFPNFNTDRQGFQIPDGVSNKDIEKLLNLRGFSCTTLTTYQGSFVYLDLPKEK